MRAGKTHFSGSSLRPGATIIQMANVIRSAGMARSQGSRSGRLKGKTTRMAGRIGDFGEESRC